MSISWIYEFLLTIHITFLKNCAISDELDEEDHKIFMRYHVWTYVQWLEEMIQLILAYFDSDLACQIDTWFWNQIVIDIQLIMFVDISIALWSWNIADSCDLLKFS